MMISYKNSAENYIRSQAEILKSELEDLDSFFYLELSPAIRRTIPVSRHILANLEVYRKAGISENAINLYLENLKAFKDKITRILMQS